VDLPIDREHTTESLGFKKTQLNPLYCGLSRGYFELMAVQALNSAMLMVGKFAADMLLFTAEEFQFFSLPTHLTTGSSIMPHKKNYDVFEVMRGKARLFPSYCMQIQAVAGGVGGGYHRDLQLTKASTIAAFEATLETMQVLSVVLPALEVHKETLESSITEDMQSVVKINKLVMSGVPFRDAYQQVKGDLQNK
jgi:argininosuccinate lyase